MTKRFGFTLAEVLITLGIIGVVAAMTIPSLMNQTGQAEFKTGYKKMISVLNQAVTMNVALDNVDFGALTEAGGVGSNSLYNLFSTRMNVVKTADATTADIGASTDNYTLFFNDGMAVSFPKATTACPESGTPACSALVDVNGIKKPNSVTTAYTTIKDQFGITLKGQQVLPNGEAAKQVMYK